MSPVETCHFFIFLCVIHFDVFTGNNIDKTVILMSEVPVIKKINWQNVTREWFTYMAWCNTHIRQRKICQINLIRQNSPSMKVLMSLMLLPVFSNTKSLWVDWFEAFVVSVLSFGIRHLKCLFVNDPWLIAWCTSCIDKIVCFRGSIPWLSYCEQKQVSIGGPNKADICWVICTCFLSLYLGKKYVNPQWFCLIIWSLCFAVLDSSVMCAIHVAIACVTVYVYTFEGIIL